MENNPSSEESSASATPDPAPSKSSARPPSGVDHISVQAQGSKVKTEAANPFLQYLSERKRKFRSLNPKGVVNVKAVIEDWRNLADEEKSIYIEKFRIEKENLGDAYRQGRKRKNKEEKEIKVNLKKKNNEIVIEKDDETSVDAEMHDEQTIEALLNKLEGLDDKIDKSLEENDEFKMKISSASTELAIKKHILVTKTESYDSFKTKYDDLLKKHSNCFKK